jgi:Tfp pilus assembly protein PilF
MGKLQSVDSGNKVAATVTAQVKIKTGDLSDLVGGLRQGMDDKEMVQFLNNAGAKLSGENDVDGAIKMYMAAVEQIKSNKFLYAIHYNLGIAFKKKKEFAKARQNFERSLKLNPEFTKATAALQELTASGA